MKRILPSLLVAVLAACSPSRNEPDPGKSTPGEGTKAASEAGHPLPSWSPAVARATELSGRKIETSTDGPWVVRKESGRAVTNGVAGDAAGKPGAATGSLAYGSPRAARRAGEVDAVRLDAGVESEEASVAEAKEVVLAKGFGGGAPAGPGAPATATTAPMRSAAAVPPATPAPAPADAMKPASAPEAPAASEAAELRRKLAEPAGGEEDSARKAEPAAEERRRASEESPRARTLTAPLRAGSTDDNAEFAKFLEFLAVWSDKKDVAPQIDFLDVDGRRFVRVVNKAGKPIPGARVQVADESADRLILSATTYGDGRAPLYPKVPLKRGEKVAALGTSLIVEASFGDARKRIAWDAKGEEVTVELDVPEAVKDPIALDVLFLIDTTGSMGDEIERIKETLLEVTRRIRSIEREFDLRYGAVAYRDLGDEYVTRTHPFTADIAAFDKALRAVTANGGGDEAESANQALAEAIGMEWRDRAAKVVFLIADAPPHMDYAGDVPYGESLRAAVHGGIRVHAVAASGLNPTGTFIFRQVAQYTRGKFIFIEYGAPGASAAGHGVAGKVESNNLDDIIFEQLREEVAMWGRG